MRTEQLRELTEYDYGELTDPSFSLVFSFDLSVRSPHPRRMFETNQINQCWCAPLRRLISLLWPLLPASLIRRLISSRSNPCNSIEMLVSKQHAFFFLSLVE